MYAVQLSKIAHLDQGTNPKHKYRLSGEWIESRPYEKHPGVLVDEKFDISQPSVLAAQKTNQILHCIKRCLASRWKEVILPLSSALVTPGALCSALEPPAHERHGPIRMSQF